MTFRRTQLTLGALLSLMSCATNTGEIKAKQEINAIHAKIDSIGAELKMLERILTSAGLDVEKGRKSIARQDSVYDIPVAGTPILGDANAPVTVVLFTDLQCPYCAQMAPVLREMQAQSPKHLKISFRHFPLVSIHDKAMNAHMALWAAGKQGKFWEYFDKVTPLFRGLTDSALVTAAQDLGLDLAKFKADKHSDDALKAVEADMKLGEVVGVEGTPSLFLNGKPTRSPSEIKAAIEMATAKK
ncbi:MAG TPA: thioredoxin domain-containing protein [Fibrobacteria bacterium]|nr:thioredoxin domain-containing protein [Fibrobacteria bacterium]